MKEAEYARDRYQIFHRVFSVVAFAAIIIHAAVTDDYGRDGRRTIFHLLPLACIWFPDALGHGSSNPSTPRLLRWGGWILMTVIVLLPWILSCVVR